MITRRLFAAGAAAGLMLTTAPALAHHSKRYREFKLDPKFEPQPVRFTGYPAGTIVVDPRNHFLYLVERPGGARRYGVGVGRAGLAFRGDAVIRRKAEWPSWRPTDNMIRRNPARYAKYAKDRKSVV